jgi:anthranilate synthase/aminodeoxychorismate synthase-like glutamine amidotransferase
VIHLLDHFDSFTFNLLQAFAALGVEVRVYRPGDAALALVEVGPGDGWVVGPGPHSPAEATAAAALLRGLAPEVPVLGVCLGHQVLVTVHGGEVVRGPAPVHGKPSAVEHAATGLFAGLPSPMVAGRYHSLVARRESLPACLVVEATALDDGAVMAVRHEALPRWGVQFHPESILTPDGPRLLQNFVDRCRGVQRGAAPRTATRASARASCRC